MLRYLLGGFAAICLFMIAKSVIEHAPQPAAAGFADGQQNITSAPSATSVTLSPTVDAFATMVAAGHDAETFSAATWTAQLAQTSAAQTSVAGQWTATAISDSVTQVAAAKTETGLRVSILVETLTAIPPMQNHNRKLLELCHFGHISS
jgi:hypothetical protein